MRFPTLVRRRKVVLPTLWGCLGILLMGALGIGLVLRGLHPFLSPTEPVGARLLVVEGWIPDEEMAQVVAKFHAGKYERIVTTGGPLPRVFASSSIRTFADLSRFLLVDCGLDPDSVLALPAPPSAQDRTFLSAVVVRDWSETQTPRVDALDVFSSGAHSRRSWCMFRRAFGPGVRIGIIAAEPSAYDARAWWRTSLGARTVLSEAIGWVWTETFFHPSPPGTHGERWGIPESSPH